MSVQRLYVVNFEMGFPVMASSAEEAESFVDEFLWDLSAHEVSFFYELAQVKTQPIDLFANNSGLPKGCRLTDRVCNGHGLTVQEAIEEEQKLLEFSKRQLKLF